MGTEAVVLNRIMGKTRWGEVAANYNICRSLWPLVLLSMGALPSLVC